MSSRAFEANKHGCTRKINMKTPCCSAKEVHGWLFLWELDACLTIHWCHKVGSASVEDGHFKLFTFCARNIVADQKSQQHFKDFPWGHCTEEFMRKQGSRCPRAQLSPQVCISLWVCLRLLYLSLPTWWLQLRCLCALLLLC